MKRFYAQNKKVRTFDKYNFINQFKLLKVAPTDIKAKDLSIEKNDDILSIDYTNDNFIINGTIVEYKIIYDIFNNKINSTVDNLNKLIQSCDIDYNRHFKMIRRCILL